MGWLSGCFGGSRRERLPRLCSRNSRHHKSREHAKHRLNPYTTGATLGSGRALLKNDVGTTNNKVLPREATSYVRDLKEEVYRLPSISTSLKVPSYSVDSRHDPKKCVDFTFNNHRSHTSERERQAYEHGGFSSLSSGTFSEERTQDGHAEMHDKPTSCSIAAPTAPPVFSTIAYRSFGWQEPLSPIAESESSICLEEEEPGLKRDSDTEVEDELSSEGSESEITPVRCSSPVVVERAGVKRSKQSGQVAVEKENVGVVSREKSGGGREKQTSVLTPVGNVMQWRQLKVEAWHDDANNKTTARDAEDKVESDHVVEDPGFFKELQRFSSEITPLQRPIRWDGQGIPNTTTKYREDQKITWHSTPFEVRLDKALASSRSRYPDEL